MHLQGCRHYLSGWLGPVVSNEWPAGLSSVPWAPPSEMWARNLWLPGQPNNPRSRFTVWFVFCWVVSKSSVSPFLCPSQLPSLSLLSPSGLSECFGSKTLRLPHVNWSEGAVLFSSDEQHRQLVQWGVRKERSPWTGATRKGFLEKGETALMRRGREVQ